MAVVLHDAGKNTLADGAAASGTNTGGGNVALTVTGTSVVKRISTALPACPGDTACYEISAQTATAANLQIAPSGTFVAATGAALGCWFMLTGLPSANHQFLRVGANGSVYIGMTTAGRLYMVTATGTGTILTTSHVAGRWYWATTGIIAAVAGTQRLAIYDAKGALLETSTAAGTVNTSAVTTGTAFFGKVSAGGNSALTRFGALRVTNDGSALIPPIVNRRGVGLLAA